MNPRLFFLPLLSPLLFSLSACSPIPTSNVWRPISFVNLEFQPGEQQGRPSIWLRDGFLPRTDKPEEQTANIGRLPPKSGAVAGICFMQVSGGKLADKSGFQPFSNEQITIKNEQSGIFIRRTDDNGYFIEALYPGKYEFNCRGIASSAVITEGQTTLVRIRGGKRMAD